MFEHSFVGRAAFFEPDRIFSFNNNPKKLIAVDFDIR